MRFPPEATLPLAETDEILELYEFWSFVRCKAQVAGVGSRSAAARRRGVAYVFGDSSECTCRRLWERTPEDFRQATCFSEFWEAFRTGIPDEQHEPVGKESGETNPVERSNPTLRQRLGRFVRKTFYFSKCDRMHEICLGLFLHVYSLSCHPAG